MTHTCESIRKVLDLLRDNEDPLIVETAEQARQMTEADPLGHVWEVGDEFYLMRTWLELKKGTP